MVYLDNAATSFPKPRCVQEEVLRCLSEYGGNPGRGAHRLSLAAAQCLYDCRTELSELFGLHAPERIVFTCNTTYALNFAIKGLLQKGDHVLISELEHNAVRRPICALAAQGYLTYDLFPVLDRDEAAILKELESRITPQTRAVVCTHASNVCSITLPIESIGAFCHAHGMLLIVDAAQSAGHLPIDMRAMHVDALAAPGHKALLGIQGCGILALADGVCPSPLLEGGSGVDSLAEHMPEDLPERYEAGTMPTPAVAGLLAGVRHLRELGLDAVRAHEASLFCAARERLLSLPDVTVYAPEHTGAVLLFNKKGVEAAALARKLDQNGICVRAGLHCAPLAHRALGTPAGGAVRAGFGIFNTLRDVDALWHALR